MTARGCRCFTAMSRAASTRAVRRCSSLHRPADDTATPGIEHHGQVEESTPGRDVGDIGDPELIRAGGREAVDGDCDMYVFVRVDPDDHRDGWFDSCDPLRHVVGLHHRLTTPSGREGGQDCDGSLSQAPIRSLPTRPDTIRMSAAGPGRQINARTTLAAPSRVPGACPPDDAS